MQVMGVTLIAAALIIPASTARLLTDRFARLLGLATILGAATGMLGMFASYYLDMASGAMIVLVGTGVFTLVWLLSSDRWQRRTVGVSAQNE
jgi:ABC-type Mn2+/Zn2+ transport system permease subunit